MLERSKRANRGQNYARWAAEGQMNEEQPAKKLKTDTQGEGSVLCSCGASSFDEGDARPMVECEKCYNWQHIECATGGGDESKLPDPYYCHVCTQKSDTQANDEEYQEDEEIAAMDEVEEGNEAGGAQPAEQEPLDKVRQSVITALDANFTTQLIPMAQKEGLMAKDVNAPKYAMDLAKEIELALFEAHGQKGSDVGAKYREKFRTLSFNLKNDKNHLLQTQIITRQVSPQALAVLSADEMLSPELRKLADQVKQESIQGSILKVDEGPRVRKTHKGEELVENEDEPQANPPQPQIETDQANNNANNPNPAVGGDNVDDADTGGPLGHIVAQAQYDTFDNYDEGDYSPLSPESSDDGDDFIATMGLPSAGPVWQGDLILKDVATIAVDAFQLDRVSPVWLRDDWFRVVPRTSRMHLEGKIGAEAAIAYLNRMANVRMMGALALKSKDQAGYDTLCNHYQSRNAYGNIKNSDRSSLVKDAYLLSLPRDATLPMSLTYAKAHLERFRAPNGNLLVVIYVLPRADYYQNIR